MSDLVERLRGNKPCSTLADVMDEAADKIEEMEAGLKLIAEGTTPWMDTETKATESWEVLAKYAAQLLRGTHEH